jgi:IS30 family transposase
MTYRQITVEERYRLGLLRQLGLSTATIARMLGRHRSTIGREVRRNGTFHDACYRPQLADWYARGRRSRSRRNRRFSPADWERIQSLVRRDWSPEQIAGRLRLEGALCISHETIYRYIWADKHAGGTLYRHLRGARKRRRKRYGRHDSRGRLPGKRPITARPAAADARAEVGHWEADTMLVRAQPRPVRTITVDNGTEFHEYAALERATATRFYFATPHHAWERGTNENTNGLLRQYLPKGASMARLTQYDCNRIATQLNRRPRKRLGYHTPEECYER